MAANFARPCYKAEGHDEDHATEAAEAADRAAAEAGDAARAIYEAGIRQSPVQGSQAIWQGVHHRWSEAVAPAGRGLD